MTGYYKCNKTNKCIPIASICDGKNDCFYNEDETDCGNYLLLNTEGLFWFPGIFWRSYKMQKERI